MTRIATIDATTLAEEVKAAPIFLLDVREPNEAALCQIPGSVLIPLGQIAARAAEVPDDQEVVVYCHHGRRSEMAIRMLQDAGLTRLRNLEGGINAWAEAVDQEIARY